MSEQPWFLDFVVRVKNLRGVVFVSESGGEASLEGLRWIGKRFRYRDIGATRALRNRLPEPARKRLGLQPFVSVQLPSAKMARVVEATRPEDVDPVLWEALATASVHACPLLLVEPLESAVPKDMWAFVVRVGEPLDAKSAKFHLRVCDYAAVDMFGTAAKAVLDEAESERPDFVGLLHQRRELARIDGEKRFWRLADVAGQNAVVAVVDALGLAWTAAREAVLQQLRHEGELAAALFSLVPVFVVAPGLTVEA